MRYIFLTLFTVLILTSCNIDSSSNGHPEPPLELGQVTLFNGLDNRPYVVVGYRDSYEGKTSKEWDEQEYVVFIYQDDEHKINEAVIHRNALIKK
ncbi:hypothetical protein [Marinigracilibium pacificum]|uniref:Uncharacterized protein n=1 Tax=Marinigracilibium pacificum TaxID=2729599 RepID=A0A848J4G5_9BACT|nr:hypothetical protein [Marinigracilibium pacificum]NMM49364.1 hypothetical protein [Marinigracilibium pacificum]